MHTLGSREPMGEYEKALEKKKASRNHTDHRLLKEQFTEKHIPLLSIFSDINTFALSWKPHCINKSVFKHADTFSSKCFRHFIKSQLRCFSGFVSQSWPVQFNRIFFLVFAFLFLHMFLCSDNVVGAVNLCTAAHRRAAVEEEGRQGCYSPVSKPYSLGMETLHRTCAEF